MIYVVATNAGFRAYCAVNLLDPEDRTVIRRVNVMVIARYVEPAVDDIVVHVESPDVGRGDRQVFNHLLQKVEMS